MEKNEQFISLTEMGCSPILSEAAIKSLKSQDIMALLDWISANEDKEDHWKEWLANPPKEAEKVEGEKKEGDVIPIDTLVNAAQTQQLMQKGHSKNVAQKSLLLTDNAGIKAALRWIEEHQYDPDFEEAAEVIFKPEEEKVKLTPEEAKQKLKELTDKARLAKKEREEADALESEKMRMKSGKQMVDAKQKGDEAAMKRKVELDRIEKEQDAAYKKRVLDEMRRDRNERFGIKEEEGVQTESIAKKVELPKYTKLEQIQLQCEQVKVGNSAYPEKARVFYETANLYVNNIIKNNGEEKYRKINQENKGFQARILEAFGGCETLHAIGYEEQGTFLVMKTYDLKQLGEITKLLQRYLAWY